MRDIFKATKTMTKKTVKELLEGDKSPMLKSGFDDYDSFAGGFAKKEVILLGGRPSMGKSAVALSIVKNICVDKGHTVVYFTTSESSKDVIRRLLGMISGVIISRNRQPSEDEAEKIRLAKEKLVKAPIAFYDSPRLTLPKVREICSQAENLDMVIIDDINVWYGRQKRAGAQSLADFGYGFHALVDELDCPVMLLTSLPRDIEERDDRVPMITDFDGFEDFLDNVDVIMSIYRDEYYDRNTDEPDLACLLIHKHNRAGGMCIRLKYDWRTSLLSTNKIVRKQG